MKIIICGSIAAAKKIMEIKTKMDGFRKPFSYSLE